MPVTFEQTTSEDGLGRAYTYQVAVQVPLPFLNLNIGALAGNFVLAQFSKLTAPKAILSFMSNAQKVIGAVVEDAQTLIRNVPEAAVNIVVRVGPTTILNVLLVAEKTPVVVSPPSFQLSAPNLAVDANLNFSIPFPAGKPIVMKVPIPFPVFNPIPLVSVSGGQVGVNASATMSEGPFGVQASQDSIASEAAASAGTSIDSLFGSAGAAAAASTGQTSSSGTTGPFGTAQSSETSGGGSGAATWAIPQNIENLVSMPSI